MNASYTLTNTLTPENKGECVKFGKSLSIKDDGTILAIGVPGDNGLQGKVTFYVNEVSLGNFSLEGTRRMGYQSVLSADGSTMVVGVGGEPHEPESVLVYEWIDLAWVLTATLKEKNGTYYRFGDSLAINANGTRLLVGLWYKEEVYYYAKLDGVWTLQQSLKLDDRNGFGHSVCMNAAGDAAVISSISYQEGSAHLFKLVEGRWLCTTELEKPIQEPESTVSDTSEAQFGISVAMDATGYIIVVGDNSVDSYKGAAYVYYQTVHNTAPQVATLSMKEGRRYDNFGGKVAISADGTTIVVGAYLAPNNRAVDCGPGECYVYKEHHHQWINADMPDCTLQNHDGSRYFGSAIAISADGSKIAVGGYASNYYDGGVWCYRQP